MWLENQGRLPDGLAQTWDSTKSIVSLSTEAAVQILWQLRSRTLPVGNHSSGKDVCYQWMASLPGRRILKQVQLPTPWGLHALLQLSGGGVPYRERPHKYNNVPRPISLSSLMMMDPADHLGLSQALPTPILYVVGGRSGFSTPAFSQPAVN